MKAAEILLWSDNNNLGYGALYNWYALEKLDYAIDDWRVATYADFNTLISYLGGASVAGKKMKESGSISWGDTNSGDNSSLFTGKGAGERPLSTAIFLGEGNLATFWANHATTRYACRLYLAQDIANISVENVMLGASVRLVYAGAGTPPSTITDEHGNTYRVIKIGTQYWTQDNIKITTGYNGVPIPNVADNNTWLATTTPAYCYYLNDIIKS